jgi:hypothetical protein
MIQRYLLPLPGFEPWFIWPITYSLCWVRYTGSNISNCCKNKWSVMLLSLHNPEFLLIASFVI